jgi:hypothetical protein
MGDRSVREPTEYVIWACVTLLGLLLGLASAFVLWAALQRSADGGLAHVAVGALGVGVVLIGLSVERPLTRAFMVSTAAMLILGYAVGGPAFAHLLP